MIGFGAAGPVIARAGDLPARQQRHALRRPPATPTAACRRWHSTWPTTATATSELWGLGYQGDQCDLAADQTRRSGHRAHQSAANVPDLRRFVYAVMAYTGAKQVDIVGHSLGVTLAREWMRQDESSRLVRRFVAIDGPNHGIINCSPNPLNYFQLPASGGFTPKSEVCVELGSPNTRFLKLLNGRGGSDETDGPTKVLVIRNADTSFVYFALQDGPFPPVPAEDSFGKPTDFSRSAVLRGAARLDLVGQAANDPILGTAHLGILNSPQTRQATLEFLNGRDRHSHRDRD